MFFSVVLCCSSFSLLFFVFLVFPVFFLRFSFKRSISELCLNDARISSNCPRLGTSLPDIIDRALQRSRVGNAQAGFQGSAHCGPSRGGFGIKV